MKLFKNALPLLSLALVLGLSLIGLNSCETIDPVIEEIEDLETAFDGTYYYNFAALQSSRTALIALEDAIKDQRTNDIGAENMQSLQSALAQITENINVGTPAMRRVKCPPFCPPSPCDNPNGIVCERLRMDLAAVEEFLLPKVWEKDRLVQLLDDQGQEIASTTEGTLSLVGSALKYKLDVPEDFKEGILQISEMRDGVETVSKVAISIGQ